jgi:Spy/CpxP family protein refolding chaperone
MFHWFRGHGPRHGRAFHRGPHGPRGGGGGGGGGMRRPLRFLIERLGLDDAQASTLSRVLDTLRLEREQAHLDLRKARSRVADLFEADALDATALGAAADVRVDAARREKDARVAAVTQLHGLLNEEQRKRFAVLLRSTPLDL